MDMNQRAPLSPGVATFIAVSSLATLVVAGQGQAAAAEGYPTLGFEFRSGDTFSFAPGGIVVFGTPANLHRPVIASLRGEFAAGGAGAGIGLAVTMAGTENPAPDLRDLMFSLFVLLEMRVERMYGSTTWNHTTFAGPEVTLHASVAPKVSLGWMANVHDATDNHFQIGIGVGF